jgi:DNA polymerase IV
MQKLLSIRSFPKAIMHMDGDAFFVSVEMAKDPSLRGKPVVTGEERGIVTALSYEAKALGVTRGLPIFQLKKLYPQVIVLPGDYATYALYSQKMFDVVRRYTEDVEEYSIDECFADFTGLEAPLKMKYEEILKRIKTEIWDELGLTVSIGLAPTKVLAKVASKWRKPNGLTLVPGKQAHEFLSEVPVGAVWGIGPATTNKLARLGIKTAYDLSVKDESWISHYLSKHHRELWKELNCISVHSVDPQQKDSYVSISKTRTFSPPTNNIDFLFSQLSKHIEDACAKARYFNLAAKKISFFLKTQSFRYHRGEISLLSRTNIPEVLFSIIIKKFPEVHQRNVLYRSAGVTLHELASHDLVQADLFGVSETIEKFEAIHNQIDKLEEKFGRRVVHLASTHASLKHGRKGTDFEDEDRNLLFL